MKRMRGDLLAGKSEIKKQKTGAAARMDVCSSPLCLGNLPCSLRNAQQEEMAFKNGSSVHAAVLAASTKPAASRNMPLRAVPTTASQFAPVWGSTAEEAVFTVPSRWR